MTSCKEKSSETMTKMKFIQVADSDTTLNIESTRAFLKEIIGDKPVRIESTSAQPNLPCNVSGDTFGHRGLQDTCIAAIWSGSKPTGDDFMERMYYSVLPPADYNEANTQTRKFNVTLECFDRGKWQTLVTLTVGSFKIYRVCETCGWDKYCTVLNSFVCTL